MKKVYGKEAVMSVLQAYDDVFDSPLSRDIADLNQYSEKLDTQAVTYVVDSGGKKAGFISFYVDDESQDVSFITLLAVLPPFQGKQFAQRLLEKCTEVSRRKGKKRIRLEVDDFNVRAIGFYEKNGFKIVEKTPQHTVYMEKRLL